MVTILKGQKFAPSVQMAVLKEIHGKAEFTLISIQPWYILEFDGETIETPFGTAYKFWLLTHHHSSEWGVSSEQKTSVYLSELQIQKLQPLEELIG